MELLEIVKKLIEYKKEGDYWDFKKEHHSNVVDLVKDIICLANVNAETDRFIIFGVNNNYDITGISNTNNRRTQNDIICCLRDSNFARGIFPDIYLYYIEELDIDLLIIKNKPEKPYFLEKDKTNSGKTIRGGVIYTRTRDSNTPNNGSAIYSEIESMWKEQFGLTNSPLERMENMLLTPTQWISNIGNSPHGYNKNAPEYSYIIKRKGLIDDYMNYFFPNHTTFKNHIAFKYHSTILFEMTYIGVDEYREVLPYPDIEVIKGELLYYYYNLETRNGKLLLFFIGLNKNSFHMREYIPPFIVLKNSYEKEEFDNYLLLNYESIINQNTGNWEQLETSLKERVELFDKSWNAYKKWKGINIAS